LFVCTMLYILHNLVYALLCSAAEDLLAIIKEL